MLPERLVPAEPRRGGPFSATRFFVSLFDQSKSEEMKRMKMRMGRRMNAVAMIPDWLVSAQTREGGLFSATSFLVSPFDQAKSEEMNRMKMRMGMGMRMNMVELPR